ncbi:AmmeMemoRadiSam system protein B [Candidatus Acetothermia bacterium]|nr:AmmeMemoRadiSam system protein B [Candidatus Acetothermia bacterium]MCI2427733.1 AmmeMemoRadiSam system protein B [Candidatus Acetothermia bacterium]MCI2428311.1 AmmeMemoRadiSam system protein B [Candidatus Acetothermia bacterium]
MGTIRIPSAAGVFYPANRADLIAELERCFGDAVVAISGDLSYPEGLISPHAGYIYSGKVAAAGYAKLAQSGRPDCIIILGANHTGVGGEISLCPADSWRTPLGLVPVDFRFVSRLRDCTEKVQVAGEAFQREHSHETQLPFLQYLYGPQISFVPICVKAAPLSSLIEVGEAIAALIGTRKIIVVASSDFTHFKPQEKAKDFDYRAIENITALDISKFYTELHQYPLSICGAGAIVILMVVARQLKLLRVELVDYQTSGDISGDWQSVVGYAAISFQQKDRR